DRTVTGVQTCALPIFLDGDAVGVCELRVQCRRTSRGGRLGQFRFSQYCPLTPALCTSAADRGKAPVSWLGFLWFGAALICFWADEQTNGSNFAVRIAFARLLAFGAVSNRGCRRRMEFAQLACGEASVFDSRDD